MSTSSTLQRTLLADGSYRSIEDEVVTEQRCCRSLKTWLLLVTAAGVTLALLLSCYALRSVPATFIVKVIPTEPTWNEYKDELNAFIHSNNHLLDSITRPLDPVLATTFPHLEYVDDPITSLLPSDMSSWERPHFTFTFATFMSTHGVTERYETGANDLVLSRYSTFRDNALFVFNHNMKVARKSDVRGGEVPLFKLEMNHISDMTADELKNDGWFASRHDTNGTGLAEVSLGGFWDDILSLGSPSSIDWRDTGCVQEVKNQAKCGSCWAFSVVEAVESAVCVARTKIAADRKFSPAPVSPTDTPPDYVVPYKRSDKLPNLSEQQLVDCGGEVGNNGCHGGLMESGFEYIMKSPNGQLCTEEQYPYTAEDGLCDISGCAADGSWKVTGYRRVPKLSHGSLKYAIANQGAVSVSIEADHKIFRLYKEGVLHDLEGGDEEDKFKCGNQLNHGVAAVGYGQAADHGGEPFWEVKNSWGPKWGEGGFVRIARDAGGTKGECGILMDASYPIVTVD